ncbi:hypothetical protein [Marinigracilibium pacificum]|uniref:Uncharacterized protein n=1 Tax=Marinigracilibium pacificum TaxID=2729599 RepID=A0A848J275_9BACT|nr:hypothetical protein [Marinigracilibium pacificum]NMM47292.1 hypothetical protein [Marinigracilibium pacificum]
MITLIKLEYKTLIKGFFIVFIVVFPFTFLPVLFKDGDLIGRLFSRIPLSLLYTAVFSIMLVMAAVAHNWSNVKDRMRYFNKPAFISLNFEYILEGQGSLVEDLSPKLYGYYNDVAFQIDVYIDLDNNKRKEIEIIPLNYLDPKSVKALVQRLNKEFKVRSDRSSVLISIPLEENKLNDPSYLLKNLTLITHHINKYSYS